MKTYTKTFAELSNKERKAFLSPSGPDETIPALVEGIENEESVNIEVAFTNEGTAIDYRVFDPYHQYTDVYTCADGWTNWFFENYDEDEDDDDEDGESANPSIITNNINGQQFCELRDFMQNLIRESMNALDSNDAESILWYEDCTMDDYFTEWTEIWDEDEHIGDGIDTIAHKFVLNDDTRPDFENAFEQARDAAFEEYMKGLVIDIENRYNEDNCRTIDLDDSDNLNAVESRLEEYDYKLFAYDSLEDHGFFENAVFYEKLMEYGACIEDVAIWAGAAILVRYYDGQDYRKDFFTGAVIEEVDNQVFAAVYNHSKYVCKEQNGFCSDVECDLLFNRYAQDWVEEYEPVNDCCSSLEDFLENSLGLTRYKDGETWYYKGRDFDTDEHCVVVFDEDKKLTYYS